MLQGLYNATSGVLTQNRNLNVISNNLVNVSTPGYKKETMVSSTFQEEMLTRSGNRARGAVQTLAEVSKIRTAQETLQNFEQGALEETGNSLDVAITGNGFFEIASSDGLVYSRNGSFILDDEGYLSLAGAGRVMGTGGALLLNDDQISIDSAGEIRNAEGVSLGTIKMVDFENYDLLTRNKAGHFTGPGAQTVTGTMLQNYVEKSNVSIVNELTGMMSSQRAIQSAAQMIKIYDQLLAKATTELGRL